MAICECFVCPSGDLRLQKGHPMAILQGFPQNDQSSERIERWGCHVKKGVR